MTPGVRQQIMKSMPNLIADGYENPRTSLQRILVELNARVVDLQRRGA
jgi:hypothetical protein